jgi:ribosomal protein S18 acetylase RimI-like enzyme
MAEALAVRIRQARPEDLPALEWGGEYRRFRRVYRQALAEARAGRRLILLAEVGGAVVGQVLAQLSPPDAGGAASPSAHLHALRVMPDYRNQGLGTRLLDQAEAELRRRGYRRVSIAAGINNAAARRLYERLGYAVVRSDPGEWSYVDEQGRTRVEAEPAYIMQKEL